MAREIEFFCAYQGKYLLVENHLDVDLDRRSISMLFNHPPFEEG